MITRHARAGGGLALRSPVTLRSTCPSPRTSIAGAKLPLIGRQHVVTSASDGLWRRTARVTTNTDKCRQQGFATAVGEYPYGVSGPSLGTLTPPILPSNDSYLGFLDTPNSLTRIPEAGLTPRPSTRLNGVGVPGDYEDMLHIFDACIQVHKLERAALILKRLAQGVVAPEQLILLHNRYLGASLQQIRTTSNTKEAESLHQWYQMHIANQDLPHTAETIACMLKASLLSERGPRLHRLVTRYMSMAPGEDGLRVLSMADILSDQDLAIITEICPTYNFAAGPEDEDAYVELAPGPETAENLADTDSAHEHRKETPELVPTPQKGLGLHTLKRGLSLLEELQEVDASRLTEADRRKIQLQLETDSVTAAMEKWRAEHEKLQKIGFQLSVHERTIAQNLGTWLMDMEARIRAELVLVEESEAKTEKTEFDFTRCLYGPILSQSEPARLATVTILTAVNIAAALPAERGIAVARLNKSISDVVQEDIQLQRKEKSIKLRAKAKKALKSRKVTHDSTVPSNPANVNIDAETPVRSQDDLEATKISPESPGEREAIEAAVDQPWTMAIKCQVGAILTKILLESCTIKVPHQDPVSGLTRIQTQPAFSHRIVPRKGKRIGVVQANDGLIELLKREPLGDHLAKHLPMVVEPKPWESFQSGGLLECKTSLVRSKTNSSEQKLYIEAAMKNGNLQRLCEGLDVLGKTPWRINIPVFEVMVEAWNTGAEIANMPPLNPDIQSPLEPDSSADPLLKVQWIRALKKAENERQSLHSQRCYMNLQLEIARVFRNQTLYFPHNVDYRGRAYPIPTYLNHMGADHTRGVLRFAEGKRLGQRGLRWLHIHLANLYGLDKASFDDREAFAKESMDNIIDSVENPLKGARWWLKAEDPWQCLAACFELKAAMELENPEDYVCSLPIHQDGTCNGLQHYAALGGDSWGARQVNLEPGSKPADVYSAVADLVKESVAKDLKEDHPFAKVLSGKITRKVVKQTVMTNVYGVTFAGAKKQVGKQLEALYPTMTKDSGFSLEKLSTYVAKYVFEALATMFRGAHDIQYWLGESGGRVCRAITASQLELIAQTYHPQTEAEQPAPTGKRAKAAKGTKPAKKATKKSMANATAGSVGKKGFRDLAQYFKSTVVWTTPFRMPVAQPYRTSSMKEVRTCLQTLLYPTNEQTDPVNRKKQLQGFPPNFIHSLDASHMLLSALKCHELGLQFAAVHDSFWTHASDIDSMNGVLRESFIQIHEEDVIGRLAKEFSVRHRGSIYLANIDSASPVAKKIMELRKNSNLTPKEELLLEHQRNTLRLSVNPWDHETAKRIITPASIYEDMDAQEEDLSIAAEVDGIGLGEIPEDDPDLVDGATAAKLLAKHETEEPSRNEMLDTGTGATESSFERVLLKASRSQANKKKQDTLQIWLPLTTPAIPEKGDFDVRRLRESQYFFS